MKTLTLTLTIALLALPVFAGGSVRCHTDYLGNYVCNGSDGSRMTCRLDYLGNTVCTYN